MRRVILDSENIQLVHLKNLSENKPIFAKNQGELVGMLIQETEGWIVRTGGRAEINGYHDTREKAMQRAEKYGFEFYTI